MISEEVYDIGELEKEWVQTVMCSEQIRTLGAEYYWTSMKFGWALAKGLPPDVAYEFSYGGEV